ncbi:hypothetical protein [Marinobacter adhaerens]|uniref:hypothetical protein n=1 Tax=Marinobacter adhaerens TaxID=1033846 RepID=UPI003BAA951A
MSQAELFADDQAEPVFEHGGYSPASPRLYRGRQIPATYKEHQGMRTIQLPTLEWLMDEILEALRGGPILSREMHLYVASTLEPSVVSRHVHLLVELGLVRLDYRFNQVRDRGRSDPTVVELVEVA